MYVGRGYDRVNSKAIPRYLEEKNYQNLKDNIDSVRIVHGSITEFLSTQPKESFDCYVFLDAQDWMNYAQLNELWKEVARTASRGARVVFRTAGDESPLTAALPRHILDQWSYDSERSLSGIASDRSCVYGGFHVYTFSNEG